MLTGLDYIVDWTVGLALKIIYMLSNETPSPVEFVHSCTSLQNKIVILAKYLVTTIV